jgi:hypothetical protein
MPRRGLDHMAPCRARQIRVVEHGPSNTRGQLLVELRGELAQGAAALVAVESDVASGGVLLGDAALPRSWNAHEEDDLPVLPRTPAVAASPAGPAEGAIQGCAVGRAQTELRGSCSGAGRLGAPGAGDRDHNG